MRAGTSFSGGTLVLERSKRLVLKVGVLVGASIALLICCSGVIAAVENLYIETLPDHPYLVLQHALILYLGMPLVALAAVVVIFAPGVILVSLYGKSVGTCELLVKGFAVSFAVLFTVHSVVTLLSPWPITPSMHAVIIYSSAILAWAIMVVRWSKGLWKVPDTLTPVDGRRLLWLVGSVVVTAQVLLPIIFWQDFNPDGLEAYSIGRSLTHHVLPRLPAGNVAGLGIGIITPAFPIHWFLALFGPVDAAARLPILLSVPLLIASIFALIEWQAGRALRPVEEAVLVLGTAVFVVALAYNGTYHMYSADLAAPGTVDILAVSWLLGMIYAVVAKELRWLIVFSVLAHFARPNAILILAMLAVGVAVVPWEHRAKRLLMLAVSFGLCILVTLGYEQIYTAIAGVDFEARAFQSNRLRFIRLDDFSRVLYLIVPSGILPALSLLAVRKHDGVGRLVAIVTGLYFVFFYLPAYTALHHFVPVMVFPLIVFGRLLIRREPQKLLLCASAVCGALALWLSLPRSFEINRTMRGIGYMTEYTLGDYSGDYAGYREAHERSGILYALFNPHWIVADPAREFIGSPFLQIHYASRKPNSRASEINYLILPVSDEAPAGFEMISRDDFAAVYVKDVSRWNRHRYGSFETTFRSRVYDIPRETLTPIWDTRNYTIDMRTVPYLWRLF